MKIFLPAWGEQHIEHSENGLLKSLSWPSNLKATRNAELVVWTDQPERFFGHTVISSGTIHSALMETISACLRDKEPLLMACADFVFSEGSIEVLSSLAEAPGTCVGMAHMRVKPSFLDEVSSLPLLGKRMVSLAVKHAHESFTQAEYGPETNSHNTGLLWRRFGKVILLQHRLPTAFLVNFIAEDLKFLEKEDFGAWDHRWPETWLGNRQRLIGSSDAAFVAEITPEGRVPPVAKIDPLERDAYREDRGHHRINRQFVTVWREE